MAKYTLKVQLSNNEEINAGSFEVKSAYESAQEGGYEGSETEFSKEINPDNINATSLAYINAEMAKRGGVIPEFAESAEWLEENGDPSKMYVINDETSADYGYIYAYTSPAAIARTTEFIGVVWTTGETLGSSENVTIASEEGHISDKIAVESGKTITVYGLNCKYAYWHFFDPTGVMIEAAYPNASSYLSGVTLSDNICFGEILDGVGYIKVSGYKETEEEPGVYLSESTGEDEEDETVNWINTGFRLTAEILTAYDYAKQGGYTGTEAEFSAKMAQEYIPKNQGAANVGKILVVGTDGNLTLADMPEGGAGGDVTGVLDESNNILLSGNLADGTYTLKYENANGTYTEIGSLVVSSVEKPDYTNFCDPSSADFKTGYRLSGNIDNVAELTGGIVTNYIDCQVNDIFEVSGINFADSNNRSGGTDAGVAKAEVIQSSMSQYFGDVTFDDNNLKLTVVGNVVTQMRFSGLPTGTAQDIVIKIKRNGSYL